VDVANFIRFEITTGTVPCLVNAVCQCLAELDLFKAHGFVQKLEKSDPRAPFYAFFAAWVAENGIHKLEGL
jgi:hypothetical protein